MALLLDPYTIPEQGNVELTISRSFKINVTAAEARCRVNRWLFNEVSCLIGADPPDLVVGERVVWRTPAWIGFPHTGRAGIVGMVEVDVTTGAMNNTLELKAEIERRAEELAARQPPYLPHEAIGEEYLVKSVPPAPRLATLEGGLPHRQIIPVNGGWPVVVAQDVGNLVGLLAENSP
jgi:hypothetical protein